MNLDEIYESIQKTFEQDKVRGLAIERRKEWEAPKEADICAFDERIVKMISEDVIKISNKRLSSDKDFNILKDCYSHQVEAITRILEGDNVVITTPTASGKSLCYQIPIINEFINSNDTTSLLIFPTNALEKDQFDSIAGFAEESFRINNEYSSGKKSLMCRFGGKEIYIGEYIGATNEYDRTVIRKRARLIFTNPDELHMGILPWIKCPNYAKKWINPGEQHSEYSFRRFFKNLKYIVVDEIHTYRGVFGANVAHVIRRLRLLCKQLGNENLQFICCSATIGNPLEHAERLVGVPFVEISENGSRRYRKDFLLWNPPMVKDGILENRRHAFTDALSIIEKVLAKFDFSNKTIIFLSTVPQTNLFGKNLQDILKRLKSKSKVEAFSGVLTPEEKQKIQEGIKGGEIDYVASTSALELGIDIGDLSICIIVGLPDNIASIIQRAGRVGRNDKSMVILILREDLLEQYFAENPQIFFDILKSSIRIRIPIENHQIVKWHLQCAIEEGSRGKLTKPYEDIDIRKVWGKELEDHVIAISTSLELSGEIEQDSIKCLRQGGRVYKIVHTTVDVEKLFGKSIRIPLSPRVFSVKTRDGKEIAKIDIWRAGLYLYEGAIWLQNGYYFRVIKYDENEAIIVVEEMDEQNIYDTRPVVKYSVEIIQEEKKKRVGFSELSLGEIRVRRSINGFLQIQREKQKPEFIFLNNVSPIEYETSSVWFSFDRSTLVKFLNTSDKEDINNALSGMGLLIVSAAPLHIECEKQDLQYRGFDMHPDLSGISKLFIFDSYYGGLGLSYEIFNRVESFIKRASELIEIPAQLKLSYMSSDLVGEKFKEVDIKNIEPIVVDKKLVHKMFPLFKE